MTILYRPVEITSAEQAEALPEGTIFYDAPGEWTYRRMSNGVVDLLAEDLADGVTVTALVPIEAEEEHMAAYAGEPEWEPDWPDGQMITRLVTPWEKS